MAQPSKVLSNVKGLAAVKVTSLIDAFNKPFLVGGLRRTENEDVQGNYRASAPANETVPEEAETVGSPDWPDERDESDEPPLSRTRGRTSSRSPGVSPEAREEGDGVAWKDPLEENEDEKQKDEREGQEAEREDDDNAPVAKKARVE